MYIVGIDISKFKHDCAIIDELGDTVTPSRSFSNDREGFSHFKALLDSLEGEKKIGLESTGHYGQNLKQFLESNPLWSSIRFWFPDSFAANPSEIRKPTPLMRSASPSM